MRRIDTSRLGHLMRRKRRRASSANGNSTVVTDCIVGPPKWRRREILREITRDIDEIDAAAELLIRNGWTVSPPRLSSHNPCLEIELPSRYLPISPRHSASKGET